MDARLAPQILIRPVSGHGGMSQRGQSFFARRVDHGLPGGFSQYAHESERHLGAARHSHPSSVGAERAHVDLRIDDTIRGRFTNDGADVDRIDRSLRSDK